VNCVQVCVGGEHATRPRRTEGVVQQGTVR
jgi:hypothetical protein